MNKIKNLSIFKLFEKKVLQGNKLQNFLFACVYFALGTVGLVMTVVNVFTERGPLMWSTFGFFILSAINLILNRSGKTGEIIAQILFQIEIVILFTFFLVSGNPEGFSAFWIPLLPACGMLLFGLKQGSIISAIMFVDITFFCWTPFGQSFLQYDYSSPFLLRFPFLYIGYYVVALFLSTVLYYTQQAYYNKSNHDTLTRVLNRSGFNKLIQTDAQMNHSEKIGFIILDLDHFKDVNDTYGHNIGDEILKYAVEKLESYCKIHICRWGGDEFAVYFPDGNIDFEYIDNLRKSFESAPFKYKNITILQTISVGAIVVGRPDFVDADELCRLADKCLYEAKGKGRNKVVFKDFTKI